MPAAGLRSRHILFSEFDLPETVRRGLDAAGFTMCTPIQAATLPITLAGRDVAGQAQTGTGKTAAFLIPIFVTLLDHPRASGTDDVPRAFIIAPTRELVVQIKDEAELLGRFTGLRVQAIYGGVDYQKQRECFARPIDILVGTPGRLIDFFKQKLYSLKRTEVLVIDEADRMFDMGFIDDIRFLLRRLSPPSERRSYLYSATLPYKVMELAYEHMNGAERVTIESDKKTADNVEHLVYHVGKQEKFATLLCLLVDEKPERALIFVNTRHMASELARKLNHFGYHAMGLAGDIDQRKRLKVLRGFKDHEIDIVVATDVASRGLHVDNVTHVFNYDLPQDAEDYVHRIGRTARAGASGRALSLACEQYVYSLEAVEDFIGFKIPSRFPDDDLHARIESMRAEARRVLGASHRSGHGEGERPQRGKKRPRTGQAHPPARKPAAAAPPASDGQAGAKKKRRRRRRKRTASSGRDAS